MGIYIQSIFVYNNYVKKNFEIDISSDSEFKNLILTGKNGSGKSTLLKSIHVVLHQYKIGIEPVNIYHLLKEKLNNNELKEEVNKLNYDIPFIELYLNKNIGPDDFLVISIPAVKTTKYDKATRNQQLDLSALLSDQNKHSDQLKKNSLEIANCKSNISDIEKQIQNLISENKEKEKKFNAHQSNTNITHFSKRDIDKIKNDIESNRTKIANLEISLDQLKEKQKKLLISNSTIDPTISLSQYFLQYLIDMKDKQAYAIADEETGKIKFYKDFFTKLENLFRQLFEDDSLKLKHNHKETLFYFEFEDGRTSTFDQIADGFKSILTLLSEILLQIEAFKETNNMEGEPTGIVLIDEIESHLHLSLQEKILPAFTSFFPRLQFIIATHSPQVCASDTNSYVYDISSGILETDYMGGYSYDVISKAHFGLESEYSIQVTEKINQAKKLMSKTDLSDNDLEVLENLKKELSSTSPELAYELILFLDQIMKTNNG